VQQF